MAIVDAVNNQTILYGPLSLSGSIWSRLLLRRLNHELEEIKERIKALEEISEENEEKFDDIHVALTELAMKQKLVATHRNPIGFIKPKEWFSPENKMQLQKSDKIIMPGDNIFAIRESRMKDNNYQVDKLLEFCRIMNFILCQSR